MVLGVHKGRSHKKADSLGMKASAEVGLYTYDESTLSRQGAWSPSIYGRLPPVNWSVWGV